jgi:hypothetical protein
VAQEGVDGAAELRAGGGEAEHGAAKRSGAGMVTLRPRPGWRRAAVPGAHEEPSICGGWNQGDPESPSFLFWAPASLR